MQQGNVMTAVSSDQFAWKDQRLTHIPTGATFELRSKLVFYGSAGDDLADGTRYEREDIFALGTVLLCERRALERLKKGMAR